MALLATLRTAFSRRKKGSPDEPHSIVLLMRKPFFLGEDALRAPAGRAFDVPYDGSSPMHCVAQGGDHVLLKAGPYLISIFHKMGAYLGKTENDVATGAAHLPAAAAHFWRQQRAWVSFDLMNEDVPEREAMRVLASLLLQVTDERCCGLFLPKTGLFLANDGTAEMELTQLARSATQR